MPVEFATLFCKVGKSRVGMFENFLQSNIPIMKKYQFTEFQMTITARRLKHKTLWIYITNVTRHSYASQAATKSRSLTSIDQSDKSLRVRGGQQAAYKAVT